jgi:alpha-1,3-rhamnosyl/mannosyltransferase
VRLAFDSRGATDPRGIGRYVRCLLEALRATGPEHEIFETSHPRRADVYHSPWIDGAAIRTRVPQVVTLHDVVPLKRRSEYLRTGMRFRLRYLAVERADRVIVPTEAVAVDAAEHLRIPEGRIVVVPEAPVAAMRPRPASEIAAARERHGLPGEYLVWGGGLEHPDPRTRIAQLVALPRELPLVLVGPTGRWSEELAAEHDVILTGHVDDDELAAVLSGARALVFPSDDEGFGLPVVEARACGTPVVASDVPAVREVADGRATLVDVGDLPGLLAAAVHAERPVAPPAATYTWEHAARATWAIYEDVVRERGRRARVARERGGAA